MHKITGVLQNYPWGHVSAIAELRGVAPSGRPEAEYWLGAHPKGPSLMDDGQGEKIAFDAVIAADPDRWLGSTVQQRFGELPFLFKVLAAAEPLSIQAHPSSEQARAGFDREETAGIAPDAFNRSYRDPRHKPELICALTLFEARCGFRPLAESQRLLALFRDPTVAPLQDRLATAGQCSSADVLADVASWLLNLDRDAAATLVGSVVAECERLLGPDGPAAARSFRSELGWTVRLNRFHRGDIGIVLALLLNHLTLQPGQALFLPSGELHVYLAGTAVELMANSDNVIRGGLTTKFVDVEELLANASFAPRSPPVQTMTGPVKRFDVPVSEFALTGYRSAGAGQPIVCKVEGPEILFVSAGSAHVARSGVTGSNQTAPLAIDQGEAVAVPAATGGYRLELGPVDSTVWRATVGR